MMRQAQTSREILGQYLSQGMFYRQALAAAATATGLPEEAIEHDWCQHEQDAVWPRNVVPFRPGLRGQIMGVVC